MNERDKLIGHRGQIEEAPTDQAWNDLSINVS